jgi:hypothetical protein
MTDQHWFHHPNPLLEHCPTYASIESIAAALAYDPLAGLNVSSLTLLERDELLVCAKAPLQPTTLSVKAAMTIINMQRGSYRPRNPTLPSGRRQVNTTVELARQGVSFVALPPAPGAAVLIIKGITGLAKSVTVLGALRLLGPQVIVHGEVEAALWKRAVQLNYLFASMSHDGSRGGLLNAILLALDKALGTNHVIDLPKQFKSIEKQAGAIIGLLHSVYLGVLVIDEIQLANLVMSDQAEKMQLFLLNLINSGIPVVLVGNPWGFAWLALLSQDASRMAEREQIFFHPCGSTNRPEDDEWDVVFDGVRKYYVLDSPPSDEAECRCVLKRRCGGIPRLALAIWCLAQRACLLDGRPSLSPGDLEAAYLSDTFADLRDLCDGFDQHDSIKLMRWRETDVPVDYYAQLWGMPLPGAEKATKQTKAEPECGSKSSGSSAPTSSRGTRAQFKAQQTREKKKEAMRDQLKAMLAAEDMRMQGLQHHGLASLKALMTSIGGAKPQAPEPA